MPCNAPHGVVPRLDPLEEPTADAARGVCQQYQWFYLLLTAGGAAQERGTQMLPRSLKR